MFSVVKKRQVRPCAEHEIAFFTQWQFQRYVQRNIDIVSIELCIVKEGVAVGNRSIINTLVLAALGHIKDTRLEI
jgi:hypothetical protein